MKRIKFILFFCVLISISPIDAFCQNLVPNPSFENYSGCPDGENQIYKATGWISFGDSPDFYTACGDINDVGVPSNTLGFQHAATGISYAGLFTYWKDAPNFREYIGAQLSSSLVIGTKYFLSMKVSPAYRGQFETSVTLDFANNLGFLFTTSPMDSTLGVAQGRYTLKTPNIISDTTNWTTIKGSFIADSAYNYIAIGNFLTDDSISVDSSLNIISGSPQHVAYYYIDNVCLTTDSLYNENYINEVDNILIESSSIKLYPNPSSNHFTIYNNTISEIMRIEITNIFGQTLINLKYECDAIDISYLPNGEYFINIYFKNNQSIIKQLIKIN